MINATLWDKAIINDVDLDIIDIVIINKKENVVYLIDISFPTTSNLDMKLREKMVKFMELKKSKKTFHNCGYYICSK